jgi:hypothetical protein
VSLFFAPFRINVWRAQVRQAVSLILIVAILVAVPLHAQSEQAGSFNKWENVERLKAGTELGVATATSVYGRRMFVAADQSSLVVMNLANLSQSNTRIIRRLVIKYSPQLLVAGHGEFVSGDVRISGDDIFVNGRSLARVPNVIERLQRSDVREVRLAMPHHARLVGRDAIISAAVGAGIGLLFGAMVGCHRGSERCDSPGLPQGFALLGGGIGLAVGTAVGVGRAPNDLIYSAP